MPGVPLSHPPAPARVDLVPQQALGCVGRARGWQGLSRATRLQDSGRSPTSAWEEALTSLAAPMASRSLHPRSPACIQGGREWLRCTAPHEVPDGDQAAGECPPIYTPQDGVCPPILTRGEEPRSGAGSTEIRQEQNCKFPRRCPRPHPLVPTSLPVPGPVLSTAPVELWLALSDLGSSVALGFCFLSGGSCLHRPPSPIEPQERGTQRGPHGQASSPHRAPCLAQPGWHLHPMPLPWPGLPTCPCRSL